MKKLFVGIVLLFCLCIHEDGYAERLTLTAPEYPPHVYANATSPIGASGAAVEIVAEALRRMGYEFTCKVLPWARGMYLVGHGDVDGIMLAYRKPGREKVLEYCEEELYRDRIFFFSSSLVGVSDPAVRRNATNAHPVKRVGVVLGYSYGPIFDATVQDRQRFRIQEYYTLQEVIAALLDGQVDMVPSDYDVALEMAKSMGKPDALTPMLPMVEAVPLYVAFSRTRDYSDVRRRMDATLRQMRTDGAMAMIHKRFFRNIDAAK